MIATCRGAACRTGLLAVTVMLSLLGCGSVEAPSPPSEAGPPPPSCGAGAVALPDGSCLVAGIPPEACGAGFAPDGLGGCAVVLPEGACPVGQMALPGDAACRELAPCGEGTYGDIPVEASTEHVDPSYLGDDSDGSRERPWRNIQQGIAAAEAGAIVALAAGRYSENVHIEGKPVRLWGRCPRQVEIVGHASQVDYATVSILRNRASGSEIRGISATGPQLGVLVLGADPVTVERVWVHDTEDVGIGVFSLAGPARGVVRDALVERASRAGLFVGGADVTVQGLAVRDTAADVFGVAGWGVAAQDLAENGARAALTMRSSLVERNQDVGVLVAGSDATIEASVVRDTQVNTSRSSGRGISAEDSPDTRAPASLTLRSSLVERNREIGVFVGGCEGTVETSVIRDTQTDGAGEFGVGLVAQNRPETGEIGSLTLRSSLVEHNRTVGVLLAGADGAIEASIVRDTLPDDRGKGGRGVQVQDNVGVVLERALALRSSLVEGNRETGVLVLNSRVHVEASVVRNTLPSSGDQFGDGLLLAADTRQTFASIVNTQVSANARAGLLFVESAGGLSRVVASGNRFGLVVQDESTVDRGEGSVFQGNADQDEILDGDLVVPDLPSALP